MDETLQDSEPTAEGGRAPSEDAATAEAGMPHTAQFAPVERPGQAFSPAPAEEDGYPGGQIPESSGFSWRLPGQPAPVQHAQGGIPNEFDHLFRDAPADDRRSLLPNQGTIGVSVPGAAGYSGPSYPQNPATGAQRPAPGPGPGPQPTQSLPPADATGPQTSVYQPPTQDQVGYPDQTGYQQQGGYQNQGGYPDQTGYQDHTGYQNQGGYGQQQMPGHGYDQSGYQGQTQQQGGYDPDQHTQAIPRVQSQMYGGGRNNGGPDLLMATGPDRRQSNRALLVAVGVFVVLIVVAVVAFSGGGGKSKTNTAGKSTNTDTPPPTTSVSAPPGVDPAAKAQADALYGIIAQSHALREKANASVEAVQQCKNVATNKQTFTDVATQRQAQADSTKAAAVDKLPGGAQLQQDLITSWQLSAESEKDYAAWSNDNLTCTGKPTANDNLNRASSAGGKAGTAKNAAVRDWNAFATKLGVHTITISDL